MEGKEFKFVEGVDFYLEKGSVVLTESYLKRRGKCCGSGCRHCPFWPRHTKGNTEVREEPKKN